MRVSRDYTLSDQGMPFDALGHAPWSPRLLRELLEQCWITPGALLEHSRAVQETAGAQLYGAH